MIDNSNTFLYILSNTFDKVVVEWDAKKSLSNLAKHHISFETAANVFADPFRIEYYDEKNSVDEDRYITLGLVERVLFVVYTMRGEKYRIISARLANAKEEEAYYGNC